ncbi:MAG: hypothetical protein AB8G99_02210 [Planctomycetaceae bacterium]
MGFFKYIKAAFSNKWNILALGGGLGFAALSGVPDVAVPIVLAAEVGYLGLLGTHEKFRKHVDAQEHKKTRARDNKDVKDNLRKIMLELPRKTKDRYKDLADRCAKLRRISENLHSTQSDALHEQQMQGLERLLWMYLKLLYTEHTLEEFFDSTDEHRILKEIEELKERIEREEMRPVNEQRERILGTLQDSLQTCEGRLANYRKADQNHELVQLELRRLENKIHSLSEMTINRKKPDFVSEQVDEVASDMMGTERTLNELEFITGLHTEHNEPVPELIRRPQKSTIRR